MEVGSEAVEGVGGRVVGEGRREDEGVGGGGKEGLETWGGMGWRRGDWDGQEGGEGWRGVDS